LEKTSPPLSPRTRLATRKKKDFNRGGTQRTAEKKQEKAGRIEKDKNLTAEGAENRGEEREKDHEAMEFKNNCSPPLAGFTAPHPRPLSPRSLLLIHERNSRGARGEGR
jgi:hypothetical protein